VPAAQAEFGWATHLNIASIGLDTEVVPASTQVNPQGELEWQTVPFVAAHYVNTAPVGSPGNAVITGHVATLREGNVFRELDRIDYGDRVVVTSDYGEFTYVVDELELVLPTQVSVMDPTVDARLTLITCGGQFDPHTRTFDHRLIVTARLVDGA
jgi:sortase A